MCLAARPGQIVEIYQYWDSAVANYTSNDLRRGAFGKNVGHNPQGANDSILAGPPEDKEGPDHRLVRGEPIIQGGRRLHSLQTPSILIASMCLDMYYPYLRGVTR